MSIKERNKIVSAGLVVLSAVLARIAPHPPNFAPIGALALFTGSRLRTTASVAITLSAMVLSDMVLGFHSTVPYVYASFMLIALLGSRLKTVSPQGLATVSLLSSVVFYAVTNFGVWMTGGMYPMTLNGLLQSYVMGLPFFRNTLLADLLYNFTFFYGYGYASKFLGGRIAASSRRG